VIDVHLTASAILFMACCFCNLAFSVCSGLVPWFLWRFRLDAQDFILLLFNTSIFVAIFFCGVLCMSSLPSHLGIRLCICTTKLIYQVKSSQWADDIMWLYIMNLLFGQKLQATMLIARTVGVLAWPYSMDFVSAKLGAVPMIY
jgi:hypothetical protein